MVYRCILPAWAVAERPDLRKVREGEFSEEQLQAMNADGYNVYFLPNHPSTYAGGTVTGADIDVFQYVFVDMDLKDGQWKSKEDFITFLDMNDPRCSFVVDSGNGVHAYWCVSDLTPASYLRLQRRLCRKFGTDEAVSSLYQLMRAPGYINTKSKDEPKLCSYLYEMIWYYTCEQLNDLLPPVTQADEVYCQAHYDRTYRTEAEVKVDDTIPPKFGQLIRENREVKDIWSGNVDDRSKGDYRLGHIMWGNGFTKDEAISVLVNSAKALGRAPVHRVNYALNIVDKIWTHEADPAASPFKFLSQSVEELTGTSEEAKGTRFPCHRYLDDTVVGFRLSHVIGLVGGVGVGKTTVALNMFKGFVANNPNHEHFFVSLEQPAREISDRWRTMTQGDEHLHSKVHVLGNYEADGTYRDLSLSEIRDYILAWEKHTSKKVGCVVIDHIGVLRMQGDEGENQRLIDVCKQLKAFAIATNTLLVIQSQTNRDKAGIGDLELNKDAAYGTMSFESYCDYLLTIWQPLKRCHSEEACPTVLAFKFCKNRHKRPMDVIREDVPYRVYFDPVNETIREMTQQEETSFDFFLKKSTNARKADRKTDLVQYTSRKVEQERTG